MKRASLPGSAATGGRLHAAAGASPVTWQLAEEAPVGILLNSEPVAVMMASPVDLEELAIGFLVAEGHLGPDEVTAALVLPAGQGFGVDIAAPGAPAPARPRALEGRSGCGLCGLEALTDVRLSLPFRSRPAPCPENVVKGFAALARHQPMRAVNRSVHAAGFVAFDGSMPVAREDVGRHCALDKLVGALVLQRIDPAGGIAVLTSRCSFELVQKAAVAGLGGLATLSAPTALAVSLAREAGLPLFSKSADGLVSF